MMRTDVCVFAAQEDLETMQAFAKVFNKLIRRYKYLEKGFEDEVKKVWAAISFVENKVGAKEGDVKS